MYPKLTLKHTNSLQKSKIKTLRCTQKQTQLIFLFSPQTGSVKIV